MLLSWKKNASFGVDAAMTLAGPEFAQRYAAKKGLQLSRKAAFLQALNFTAIPPACYMPAGLLELLKKNGVLWVTVDTATEGMTHAVIVRGLAGDGTDHGTLVSYIDPADGKPKTMPFDNFQTKFESAAGKASIQLVSAK